MIRPLDCNQPTVLSEANVVTIFDQVSTNGCFFGDFSKIAKILSRKRLEIEKWAWPTSENLKIDYLRNGLSDRAEIFAGCSEN
jgi:hypothetical protein